MRENQGFDILQNGVPHNLAREIMSIALLGAKVIRGR